MNIERLEKFRTKYPEDQARVYQVLSQEYLARDDTHSAMHYFLRSEFVRGVLDYNEWRSVATEDGFAPSAERDYARTKEELERMRRYSNDLAKALKFRSTRVRKGNAMTVQVPARS